MIPFSSNAICFTAFASLTTIITSSDFSATSFGDVATFPPLFST